MDHVLSPDTTRPEGEIAISIDPNILPEPFQRPTWLRICSRMLHHVHVERLLVLYTSLIGLVQLKFQSTQESAFETHCFFMFMSLAAVIIFVLSYWILDYTSYTNQLYNYPIILQKILVIVALFTIILAPLSLVLVLLVPPTLMWIGYSIVCLIVIAIIAYNSIHHVTSLGQNMHAAMWKLFNYIKDKIVCKGNVEEFYEVRD
ncbi:unnamed protein product [Lactuca virosa]|uniref:Uncharacterized protein n=1 Tax=Lactuca virosa TaxID=75947 RepID=A0AAU9MH29_9ASTR|nr:unnamed protein product [Lactuca virosa]